jgi:hypothetical protein
MPQVRIERVYVSLIHVDKETLRETKVWQGWAMATTAGYEAIVPGSIIKHPLEEYKWRRLPGSGPHAFK